MRKAIIFVSSSLEDPCTWKEALTNDRKAIIFVSLLSLEDSLVLYKETPANERSLFIFCTIM